MPRNVADIRNLAICGHGSAGKTSLVDLMLVKSGAVNANPSVDAGTSICDFDEEEKHHHHSIEATITHFDHNGKRVNLIDTPGYPDLVGQMIGSLRAVETALIAVDAHAGVKVNTRRAWSEATKAGCGKIIVLTKLDTDNIDLPGLVESLREVFGPSCALLNVPLGTGEEIRGVASTLNVPEDVAGAAIDPNTINEALIESIIEVDEGVMERYFEGELPSPEELAKLMVQAIAAGSLTPIVCVSSKKDIGVSELMDLLASTALPPHCRAAQGSEVGRRSYTQARRVCSTGRPGLQDSDRSLRAEAQLRPCLRRHAQERLDRSDIRLQERREARPAVGSPGGRNQTSRRRRPRRHRCHRQDGGSAHWRLDR